MLLLARRILFFFICKTVENNNPSSLDNMLPQTENSLQSNNSIHLDQNIKYSPDLQKKDCDRVVTFQQQLDILVVDDSHINRMVLANILQQQGHYVIEAENGKEALDATDRCYNNHQPLDLIFMDIDMPVMDGLTATKHIREQYNLDKNHLIIIAYTSRDYLEQNYYGYFNGYLHKPAKSIEIHALLFKFTHPSSPIDAFESAQSLSPPPPSKKSQQNNLNSTNNHGLVLGIAI